MKLTVNDRSVEVDDAAVAPDMPLLWVLRDVLGLTGTKYACGIGACGACTVHLDGQPQLACVTPLAALRGRAVRTIEGLARDPRTPHPLQRAWLVHQVPQCGWCQSGLLMAAAALLARNRNPSDAEIDAAITNLCRCGTTPRLRDAIRAAGAALRLSEPAPKPRPAPAARPKAAEGAARPASGPRADGTR